jgi:tetratricopeptide (TPR) repeat protein
VNLAGYLAAIGVLLNVAPLWAQQDSVLRAAVQMETEGRGDSARAIVRARLAALGPTDSLYPEVLFTAGVVAGNADTASTYFRRVSIEFARSDWAAPSLLRLAQLAFAADDYQAALRSAQRVLTDYPLSNVRAEASFWAGRASLELGYATDGCRLLQAAQDSAGDNIELAHRAAYHLQRCATVRPAATDSAASDPASAVTPTAGPVVYAVQIAAVQSAAAADELMRSLYAAGYQPQVIRDTDGLFKVRVGRYTTKQDAQRLAAEIKRKLGGTPFVVEQH